MILDNITLLMCTFNTNKMTTLAIKSLFKQLGRDIPVVLFDNGNKELCTEDMKEIFTVYDNSHYKLTGQQNQLSRNHCIPRSSHSSFPLACPSFFGSFPTGA